MDGNGEQVTFSVGKNSVGLVIGRGGSNIKDLEQKFRVKVNIGKIIIYRAQEEKNDNWFTWFEMKWFFYCRQARW